MRADLKNRSSSSTRASPAITKHLKSVEELATPCSSSFRESCFKENVNINKPDATKLSAEPLAMKRKKKGGGYNLRKSLAWDRAFFTEEGVLDPIELSTISGTSCGEGLLFAIDEEISSASSYTMESTDTLAIENDLTLDKCKRSDCLPPKPGSSAPNDVISTSMTSQKSTRPSSKFGSSCGDIIRPPPSSYLKRPANITAAKSATSALKLLKVPVPKSGPRRNYLKHNQVTEPVVSIQRNIGSKRSSEGQKDAENTSQTGTLRPYHHLKGNSENSLQKGQLSFNKSPLFVDKPDNSASKMISDNMVPFNTGHSFESRDEPTTISISVAQNACISGGNMHPSPNQAARPSGLRMPSPSLSFFSQPKTSGLCSVSWKNIDSNVCGIHKLEDLRSHNTLRKTRKMANGTEASTSNSNRLLSSRSECSAPSEVSAISCGIIESNMEENSSQKVGIKVFDANSFELKGNNIDVNGQNQDVLKQIEIEKMIPQEDIELLKNVKDVPLHRLACEKVTDDKKLKSTILGCPGNRESCMSGWGNSNLVSQYDCLMLNTGGSETKAATDELHKGPKICKHDIQSQTRPEDVNDHRWQNSMTVGNNLVETCMQDCHEPPREQTDQLKFSSGKTDQGLSGDNHILKTNGRGNEPAKESQEYGSWYVGNVDHEALESNMKSPCSATKNEQEDLSVEAATKDAIKYNLHVGQAQLQASEDILTIKSSKNKINHILMDGASDKQSGKASELQDIRKEVELDSRNNCILHTSDGLFPEKQACCIESLQEKLTETLPVVAMAGKDGNQFFDIYVESTQAPAAVHDDDLNIDRMTKHPLIRDALVNSVKNIQSSESRSSSIDLTSSYDGVIAAKAKYFELNSSYEVINSLVGGGRRLPDDNDKWNMGINELEAELLVEDSASKQLPNSPHQETQVIEMNYSSLFSRSMVFEESQQIIIEKTTDSRAILDNLRTPALTVKEGGFGVDKESTVSHTQDLMVQLYDKALNECCVEHTSTEPSQYVWDADTDCNEHSGHLKLRNPVVVEDLFCSNDVFPLKNHSLSVKSIISDEYDQSSVLDSMVDSVTKPSDLQGGEMRSSVNVQKPTLMHKICRDADEIVGQSCIHDQNKIEGSQDNSTSVSEQSDEDKAAFASISKFGDGLKKKSHTFVPPQHAVPFSDEWLAAIEAAGEDILTMKSGAVQHSPPDKSLPEPNPWSPVKRKTNQIGPYDCTKFTTISPSNSS